jgi:hypothetical protein
MTKTLTLLFLFISSVVYGQSTDGVQMCDGDFALCAASTCTPTGRTISVKGKIYPEAVCECPVLNGKALADVTGGTMQGSCDSTHKGQVWSLFSYQAFLPQKMNDWATTPSKTKTRVQECSAELNLGSQTVNCFSMSCEITSEVNGVIVASCSCPIGQSVDNEYISPATTFLIQSGQGDSEYCGKHPVAITPWMQ